MCNIPRLKLEVEIPGRERASEAELVGQARHFASAGFAAAAEAPGEPKTLATELRRQLAGPGSRKRGGPGSMLFLSGGSQQGAFGAGFLNGWSEARGGDATRGALPEFTVVTGISTGAILSTWAFLNDPAPLAREYRISREEEILDPFVSGNAGSLKVATTLARRGALGDLTGFEGCSPRISARRC
jgi:predicted acylesterase/phospholipase RssA